MDAFFIVSMVAAAISVILLCSRRTQLYGRLMFSVYMMIQAIDYWRSGNKRDAYVTILIACVGLILVFVVDRRSKSKSKETSSL